MPMDDTMSDMFKLDRNCTLETRGEGEGEEQKASKGWGAILVGVVVGVGRLADSKGMRASEGEIEGIRA